MSKVPTIKEVMDAAKGPCGAYYWNVEGGQVEVGLAELSHAVNFAYDSTMPDWPSLVEQYL